MNKKLESWLSIISWSMFAVIPVVFVVSLQVHKIFAVVLMPSAMVFVAGVIILDIIRKRILKGEQVFKFLVYGFVGCYTFSLYDCNVGEVICGVISTVAAFTLLIRGGLYWESLEEETKLLNKEMDDKL